MITEKQFDIMYSIYKNDILSQGELAQQCKCLLSEVNYLLKELIQLGLIEEYSLTQKGLAELNKYKVDNAVIMAAGLSSRFAPLSYENPKGLLDVKGEVLIERQIKQLKEVGVNDITIVVGYMMEKFFYLEDKFNVKIVVNEEYNKKNNNSTLFLVKDILKNSYICSSDNYFTENVFETHIYKSYYSAVYEEGETDEYCMVTGLNGRIDEVIVGGKESWIMLGHVYFSKEFSNKFVNILVSEYNKPEVAQMLWEDIYIKHINELDMYIRNYEKGNILEFDNLDDLRNFDERYINNADSKILKNICKVLCCEQKEIKNIIDIKKGLTNISFKFECKDKEYVYRHPGVGTEEIINRKSEAYSQKIARELEIDNTFIYMCPNEGYKISSFIDNCIDFDYRSREDVEKAMKLVRKLHEAGIDSEWEFNIFQESEKLLNIISEEDKDRFNDFSYLREVSGELYKYVEADNVPKILCHNDCYDPNFLTNGKDIYLIDWEYSGKSDPASDLGTFICCSDYSVDEAKEVLRCYFRRDLTLKEERHYIAYIAICSYYWLTWAIYKESMGQLVGEYVDIWYNYTKKYGDLALELYKTT